MFSQFVPEGFVQKLDSLIRYADMRLSARKALESVILLSAILGIVSAVAAHVMTASITAAAIAGVAAGAAIPALFLLGLRSRIYNRASKVDKVLPDALSLIAMNLRAGMTVEQAFLTSARPEFGPLEQEIRKASRAVASGRPLNHAMLELTASIKSEQLSRTIRLIVEGMQAGGELASLLEITADDLQSSSLMKKEVEASVSMYAIFIAIAAGIGAPLLYAVSTHLLEVFSSLAPSWEAQAVALQSSPAISGFQPTAMVAAGGLGSVENIVITGMVAASIFAGLIIGIIKGGMERQGLRYIPILLALSALTYIGAKGFLASVISI